MSATVLPTLKTGFPAERVAIYKSSKSQSASGKETAIARWAYPRYRWTLKFPLLRQGTIGATTFHEFRDLEAFFENLKGGYDSWLYTDPNDNAVTGQAIGIGDSSTQNFALVRTFGGHTIPVLAPNMGATLNIYVNAVLQDPADYTVTSWGTGDAVGPGVVKFDSAPGVHAITADFSYYFPCRFDDDEMSFDLFAKNYYSVSGVSFTSIK